MDTKGNFPTLICINCLQLARTLVIFQKQCSKSQTMIETYLLQKNKNERIKNEFIKRHQNMHFQNCYVQLPQIKIEEEFIIKQDYDDDDVDSENHEINSVPERDDASMSSSSDDSFINNKLKSYLQVNNKLLNAKKEHDYMQSTKSYNEVYDCDLCGETFNFYPNFESHLKMHNKAKYVCNICGKNFDQHSTFINHLRTHTENSIRSNQVYDHSLEYFTSIPVIENLPLSNHDGKNNDNFLYTCT